MGNAASCAVFNEAPYPILVEQYAPKDSLAEFTVATFQLRPGEACEVPPLKKHKNVRIKVSAPEEGRCGELPQTLHAGQHLRIHRVKKVKTARDFIKDECSSASTSPSLNLEHASSCPDRVRADSVMSPLTTGSWARWAEPVLSNPCR